MIYDIGDIVCVLPYDEVPDAWGVPRKDWIQMLGQPLKIINKDEVGYYIKYYKKNNQKEYWWIYESAIKGLYETSVSLSDISTLV